MNEWYVDHQDLSDANSLHNVRNSANESNLHIVCNQTTHFAFVKLKA